MYIVGSLTVLVKAYELVPKKKNTTIPQEGKRFM